MNQHIMDRPPYRLLILTDTHAASLLKAADLVRDYWEKNGRYYVRDNGDTFRDITPGRLVIRDFYLEIDRVQPLEEEIAEMSFVGQIREFAITVAKDPPLPHSTRHSELQILWKLFPFMDPDPGLWERPQPRLGPIAWYSPSTSDSFHWEQGKCQLAMHGNPYFRRLVDPQKRKDYELALQIIHYKTAQHGLFPDPEDKHLKELVIQLADISLGERNPMNLPQDITPERFKRFSQKDHPLLVGQSAAIETLRRQIRNAATVGGSFNVLLIGEAGTGRDTAALFLHEFSPQGARPYIEINCAAHSPDELEELLFGGKTSQQGVPAKGPAGHLNGKKKDFTVFLDELEAMPATLQARLLHWLQNDQNSAAGYSTPNPILPRLLAGITPQGRGQVRGDLLACIADTEIALPSLRELRDDIPILAQAILEQLRGLRRWDGKLVNDELIHNTMKAMEAELEAMKLHPWENNLIELRGYLRERLLLDASTRVLTNGDEGKILLPVPEGQEDILPLEEVRKRYVNYVWLKFHNPDQLTKSRQELAERLGISSRTLHDLT